MSRGFHDQRADRDVGDEVPVHHVYVNQSGASALGRLYLFAESREIGRQD